MLITILTHTPLWVWALLAALLALGLWQTRPRRMGRARVVALPLVLLALGLVSLVPMFLVQPVAGLLWLGALAGFTVLGRAAGRRSGAVWLADQNQLQLPGSWLPFGLILAIFSLRYANGVSLALHPAWRNLASVQWPLAVLFGALSGFFLGRALGLVAAAAPQPAPTIDAHGRHSRL